MTRLSREQVRETERDPPGSGHQSGVEEVGLLTAAVALPAVVLRPGRTDDGEDVHLVGGAEVELHPAARSAAVGHQLLRADVGRAALEASPLRRPLQRPRAPHALRSAELTSPHHSALHLIAPVVAGVHGNISEAKPLNVSLDKKSRRPRD